MPVLYALLGVVLFSFVFKDLIKRVPIVFYALALLLLIVFFGRNVFLLPPLVDDVLFILMQKAHLAFAFFVVVMFIGALSEKSRVRIWLQPIRAELSIIGCILALGHIVRYLASIGVRILSNPSAYSINIQLSFYLSLFLTLLLLLLGVTSFKFIKHRMSGQAWKRVQWLAYPFFLLIWIHVLLYLLPAALTGSTTPLIAVVIYSVIFTSYLMLRITLAYRRKRASAPLFRQSSNTAGSDKI